jgi:hypothetical protein
MDAIEFLLGGDTDVAELGKPPSMSRRIVEDQT